MALPETMVIDQASGKDWTLYQGDSVEVIKGIPDCSVGLSVFSPPFGNIYVYSDSMNDMGNSASHEEFADHYRYLTGELLRITKPGRLCVVHCKDLPLYKNRDGVMGLYPFPDLLVKTHLEAGWVFHSRVTIWKDPVTEMQRTKNHGLLYKELCKDSCGSRQGMGDYLLVFRNWSGPFNDPVHGEYAPVGGRPNSERFGYYVGLEPPDPTEIADEFSFMRPVTDKWGRWPKRNPFPEGSEAFRIWSIKAWQKYASNVWFDIDNMDCLNEQAKSDSERHICPIQLQVVERAIHLWSNPGDVVFSPFVGIGSELVTAIKVGRRGLGIELKREYYDQSCKFLRILEQELGEASLFDSIDSVGFGEEKEMASA